VGDFGELLQEGIRAFEAHPVAFWGLMAGMVAALVGVLAIGSLWLLLRLVRGLRAQNEQLERASQDIAEAVMMRTGDLAQLQNDHLRDLRQNVSQHLTQLQRGVGELQGMASGWSELQRTLGNVKRRGAWGEAQLEQLLGDFLAPDQYDLQLALRAGSQERVDAALRLRSAEGATFHLPIDSKFPLEDYLRLLAARERGDGAAEAQATRQLAARVRGEARRIASKYIAPPETTDFGVLFVPTESLYAEIARIPDLLSSLHQESSVTLAGPANLGALLSSIRLGLRAVALQERAGELWQQLGLLQTDTDQLIGQLERARRQLGAATRSLERAEAFAGAVQHRLAQADPLQEPPTAPAPDIADREAARSPELPPTETRRAEPPEQRAEGAA